MLRYPGCWASAGAAPTLGATGLALACQVFLIDGHGRAGDARPRTQRLAHDAGVPREHRLYDMKAFPQDGAGQLSDTAASGTTVLDADALAGLAQLDPTGATKLVVRVLNTYLGSLARLRLQLVQAGDAGDTNAIRLAAHTLKSSSASIGALRLSALCGEAEQAVRDGQLQGLSRLLDHLLAECLRVDAAVRQLLTD